MFETVFCVSKVLNVLEYAILIPKQKISGPSSKALHAWSKYGLKHVQMQVSFKNDPRDTVHN